MNGPHDMGGFTGFGPINPEKDEPVFHAEWERRAFGLVLCIGALGRWNIDISRHARERIPARSYWASSYYEIWLKGMETLIAENGLATKNELESGRPAGPAPQGLKILKAAAVPSTLARGGPASRPSDRPRQFNIGDSVRVRNITPEGHTRLVRYARGRAGEIVAVHGTHVFPDSSAQRLGDDPQWLYTVRFTAKELWGKDAKDSVQADLWEPYLEPA
jgi:nitrile hydratase